MNTTGTRLNGSPGGRLHRTAAFLRSQLHWAIAFDPKPEGVDMERQLKGATSFRDRSDMSVALMYQGRAK